MKIISGNKGQTLVEFALVSILFLAVVFAVMEFGRLWYYSTHLGNSVRAAARYGAVLQGDGNAIQSGTTAFATAEITAPGIGFGLPPSGLNSVTTTMIGKDGVIDPNSKATGAQLTPGPGDIIRVSASYYFEFMTGSFLNKVGIMPAGFTLTREASVNYE